MHSATEYWLTSGSNAAAFGEVLSEIEGIQMIDCALECINSEECDAANYAAGSGDDDGSCSLLDMEDELDDWQYTDENITLLAQNDISGIAIYIF